MPVLALIGNIWELKPLTLAWSIFVHGHYFPVNIFNTGHFPQFHLDYTKPIPVGKYNFSGYDNFSPVFKPVNPEGPKYCDVSKATNSAPPASSVRKAPRSRPSKAKKAEKQVGASSSANRKERKARKQTQKSPKDGKPKSNERSAFPDSPVTTEVSPKYARTEETEQAVTEETPNPKYIPEETEQANTEETPNQENSVPSHSSSSSEDDDDNGETPNSEYANSDHSHSSSSSEDDENFDEELQTRLYALNGIDMK